MISVCIATFNGEKYIKEQLMSILFQLSSEDEIIISDDGSTDNTLNIIESFNSPIIHIFINNGEHGYTSNFENTLRHINGDIVFFSDQDDVWMSDKVSVCMKYLQKYSFVISDAVLVDEKGDEIADSFYAIRHAKRGWFKNIVRFSYLGCCIAFRREILRKALPFPSNHILCTHDNWITLIAMTYYNYIAINDKLIRYRRHENNNSGGGLKNATSFIFKIRYRLYLIWWLILRLRK